MARDLKQTERERAVFARFLEAHASLAAGVASFSPAPGDFPDILVKWKTGGSAGFELGEWLHARQMAEAKRKETLRAKLREVLSQRIKERPHHIGRIALEVTDTTFRPEDADAFATELSRIVCEVDETWQREPWRQQPGYPMLDFANYAKLGKYVYSILPWPPQSYSEGIFREALSCAASDPEIPWERFAEEAKAQTRDRGLKANDKRHCDPWIEFPGDGGAYSSESALEALAGILAKKSEKYAARQSGDLRLVIYYDEAVLYNTPYEDLKHETFADMAYEAARLLTGKDVAPFNRIYLLRAPWPNPKAFEVWPSFSKCD
ncbi:MAG: hypothetical protein ACREQX_05120 [Candidatus Binataceae bacterium]